MKILKSMAVEMALAEPTQQAKEFFDLHIKTKDYLPTLEELMRIYDSVSSANLDQRSINMLSNYAKIYSRILHLLSLYWKHRGDEQDLCDTILQNPARGDRRPNPGKDPFDSAVPEDIRIAESLQGLRNWIDYYNSPLWALWRPELKRMINEIAMIVKKRKVRPYRPTTARSQLPTKNPIRTLSIEINKENILEDSTGDLLQEVWVVKAYIRVDGGLVARQFIDFYDTEKEAAGSDLYKDAKLLSVPEYTEKYADNEVVAPTIE